MPKKSKKVKKDSNEIIRLSRLAADRNRDRKRANVDSNKTKHRHSLTCTQTSRLDDQSLVLDRDLTDNAQNIEREKEDRVHAKERFQKRLIASALLDNERWETDTSLLNERVSTDLKIEQDSIALVTRDQFLAIVSHDLRGSLSAVMMSAALMRRYFLNSEGDEGSFLEYLEIIDRNAANMDRMISDLLDVERMVNGKMFIKPESCDIGAFLREGKDLFVAVAESKSISMTNHTCPESIFADFDHDRALQVLCNLIGNALKFTPKGGTIKVSAQKKVTEIEISVTDNGPGIPEDKRAIIFEKYVRLQNSDRSGLGLGLFISKGIVEAHKGRIWVTSDVGKGSTFTFTLPVI